jgi:hypothetical protein
MQIELECEERLIKHDTIQFSLSKEKQQKGEKIKELCIPG